jgi:hypothetical protein
MLLLSMDKIQKDKTVLFNFSHALFSLLPTHDNFLMQALVWHHMVQDTAIWFGTVQFSASFMNLG